MLRKIFYFFLFLFFVGALVGGVGAVWAYHYVTRDLPALTTIEDYKPPAVSRVYANDGTLAAEFFRERRYPVKLKEVPIMVRNCFLAAEDVNFYSHPGIDPMSILRAMVKNFQTGHMSQGGSTITQQVVKNMLLSPEKKLIRKVKEAILSYRLEKRFTKDEILEMYLNQIFFGNTAYGIRAAAKAYFHKELGQVTLAEGALLAGLPKAPTAFSPLINADRAKRRQQYVLGQMVRSGFVTAEEAEVAKREKIKVYPATYENIYRAPYYIAEVRKILGERWKDLNPDTDGLEIYTSLDVGATDMAVKALRKGLKEVDKRRGWRGPLGYIPNADAEKFKKEFATTIEGDVDPDGVYPAMVKQIDITSGVALVDCGFFYGRVDLKNAAWAHRKIDKQDQVTQVRPELLLRVGDVIEVSLNHTKDTELPAQVVGGDKERSVVLDQTPDVESALTAIDPHSGKVIALVGGYSYKRSVFNRATQSQRQPGSSFKPIVYLSAVDGFKYTPATIVYDTPRTFRVGDQLWTPGNFDKKYMGAITLRTALTLSRNLVSADIVSRIGVDAPIEYARKLGIASPLGRNPSLALGSSEVNLLELTRAYGVFAARGMLFDSVFIEKIVDRNGNVIYDYSTEAANHAHQVISENSAFVMANMMKGVVEHGTGYKVKELGRPVAGKTGTSNEEMDAWFIGYTPNWVCGVWTGFDLKKKIGEKETGGKVSAPIFLYFMRDFLAREDESNYAKLIEQAKAEAEKLGIDYVAPEKPGAVDFTPPEGVEGFWVNKTTGYASSPEDPGAIYEYFVKGTEPNKYAGEEESTSYLESPDL